MSAAEEIARGDELVLSHRIALPSFLGLSFRNGLLNLVTLTLYRFWGKTEVRRRLWRSIYLNDEPFEYTGRGVELFLGFLLALGVIVLPFLIIAFGAQLLGPLVAGLAVLPLYVVLGLLYGFGRFTAFRYLATRSSWRGIRFGMKGSPFTYALKWLGYGLLTIVSFGWFWPAAQRRLAAPLWDGLRFGDRRFGFDIARARETKVYGAYALGWIAAIIGYFVLVGLTLAILAPLAKTAQAGGPPPQPTLDQMLQIYALAGILALFYVVAFAPFHAAMLRSIVSGIGFEDARFRLRLKWPELAGLTLTNVVMATASFGFLMPFIEARTARFLIARLEAEGVVDMEGVRQSPEKGPRTGEGLADAFGAAAIS
jgi:uncharacterized membrane protein YjgN (DUF898 family)